MDKTLKTLVKVIGILLLTHIVYFGFLYKSWAGVPISVNSMELFSAVAILSALISIAFFIRYYGIVMSELSHKIIAIICWIYASGWIVYVAFIFVLLQAFSDPLCNF